MSKVDRQADNPAVIGDTANRRNDNSRYNQRRKSRQIDDPLYRWDKKTNTAMM